MKPLIILFILSALSLQSQSISIFDIDTTNFPTMRAKFYAFDAAGNQTRPSASELTLSEDGVNRTITNVSCPVNPNSRAISSVLVIDVSGSMSSGSGGTPNIELAKIASRAWVNGLPLGKSNCAITSFDGLNYLNQDFTTNRTRLLEAIDKLQAQGGTDYDMALLNPSAGGLMLSKSARYKKVIIILTDGQPNREPNTSQIITEAKAQNCEIYAVTLGMPAPQSLKDITKATGGQYFENVTTIQDAEIVYKKLLNITQKIDPCTIEWQRDYNCKINNKIDIELKYQTSKDNESYTISNEKNAELTFSPTFVRFENPPINTKISQEVTITAKNKDFNISDIIPSNPLFEITPNSLIIPANQSQKLIVSYIASDNAYTFCRFEIKSDFCNKFFFANAGWKGVKPNVKTLKLTHPNGGEAFIAGSDTVITWEGIPATDTVKLEYSIDNGKTWKNITEQATGLKYEWKNIPLPASTKCLVRISQMEVAKSVKNEPSIVWQKNYGGSSDDYANSIIETQDGNLIVAGYSKSNEGDLINNKGGWDYWVLKINSQDGNIVWQKNYGGYEFDRANSIIETQDGNLIVAGSSNSRDGDVTNNKGGWDYWVLKINSQNGNIIWKNNYGGSIDDGSNSIIETQDGNLVLAGYSVSGDGDLTNNKGDTDYWVLKINSQNGNIIWQKSYGGTNKDRANSIIETHDGNLIVAGSSFSSDGDLTNNKGSSDYWVLKIYSQNGNIIWQKNYGGSINDEVNSIIETQDGNLVVAGYSISGDGDLTNNKGGSDYWVLKISSQDGNIIWQKNYGGSRNDIASSIIETQDGNLIITGESSSSDGDLTNNISGFDTDYWVVRINSQDRSIIWQNNYGGRSNDNAKSVIETKDGNLVVAGSSFSSDGDLTNFKGGGNYWVLKLSNPQPLQSDTSDAIFSIVAPSPSSSDIDMKEELVGSVKDSLITDFVTNIGSYQFRVDSVYFTGVDANSFSLVSGFPKYTVLANSSKTAEVRFKPKKAGIHNAQVVIVTPTDTLIQNITGVGVQPQLEVVGKIIDFQFVEINTSKTLTNEVTIKNIGGSSLTITKTNHNLPNDKDFKTLSGGGSFVLQPNEVHKMDFEFSPTSQGRQNGVVEFHYNGLNSPAIVQLYGTSGVAELDIEVVNVQSEAGKVVSVPIKLSSEKLLNLFKVNLSFDIEYNRTLLYPKGYTPRRTGKQDIDVITVNNIQANKKAGETLTTIDFDVALGNAQGCELTLSNPKSNDNNAIIYAKSGSFTLLGICEDGGARLINPELQAGIMSISPNPTNDNFNVEVSLIESAPSELILLNSLGQQVMTILSTTDTGKHTKSVNTDQLSTGIYYLQLRTATYIENKVIRVEK